MSSTKIGLVTALAALAISGCKSEKPSFTYMPDMAYSPAAKAQEPEAMRLPVEGTRARGQTTYPYAQNEGETAGRLLRNPLPMSREVLYRGQKMYNTFCIVCHGEYGEGVDRYVQAFPIPPSLVSDKIRGWSDGRIYHVITTGQNIMPSYASQVDEEDRWAIAHYIRVLQRAKAPTAADIRAYEQEYK